MTDKSRRCKKCGSAMAYRLGEFECPQCGYREPEVAVVEEKPAEYGMDYGGVKRARLLMPPPSAPGAPSTSTPHMQASTHGAGTYIRGGIPPEGLYGYVEGQRVRTEGVNPTLHVEKNIYFGINTALSLLGMLGWLASLAMTPAVVGGVNRAWPMLGSLFGYAIGLGLLWIALYSPYTFAKWACIGLCGLSVLLLIIGGIILLANTELWQEITFNTGGIGPSVYGIAFLLQVAWLSWFISILYRDIQRLGG